MPKDDRLIYLMTKAQHCLKSYLKKAFVEAKISITPVQTGILFLLKKKPHTMTEISQILSTDNSAITGLVDRLEKAGLALRKTNPNDRRTFLIHITDHGVGEIDKAYKIVKKVNEEIKTGFTEQEVETFKKFLDSFFIKFKKNNRTNNNK